MTTLQDLGLAIAGTSEEYSESVEEGKVCGTDPVVGTSVTVGSSVTIIVSKGAESEMVTVPYLIGKKEAVALERLADVGLEGDEANVTYVYSSKYAKGRIVNQSVKAGTRVEVGTKIDYTVSKGPKNAATPTPTTSVSYSYVGTVTISSNPFEYEDDAKATIKLVLTQDGKSRTVYSGKLGYDDFPKKFTINGWSENNGTITVCKGDDVLDGSYNVEFKKVAQ